MAVAPAKFIQLTSTALVAGNVPQIVLHALDQNGQVWQWFAEHQHWIALAETRLQTEA